MCALPIYQGAHLGERLDRIAGKHGYATKGRGMFRGIDVGKGETASAICAACFEQGLVIETSGAHDEVVKVLAPLTITRAQIDAGLDILEQAFARTHRSAAAARSEEHTSELQSLMRISYAVFCLKKKQHTQQ